MTAYWAILKDSFRAAFASRLLWVMLALIALVLLVLLPLRLTAIPNTNFSESSFNDLNRIVDDLGAALESNDQASAIGRIAMALPDPTKKALQARRAAEKTEEGAKAQQPASDADPSPPSNRDRRQRRPMAAQGDQTGPLSAKEMATAFDSLLQTDGWYDATAWKKAMTFGELKQLQMRLQSEGSLDDVSQQRLRRKRIEAVFPQWIRWSDADKCQVTYLGYDLSEYLESILSTRSRDEMARLVNDQLVPWILWALLGIVGILIAILVTASVIPDMFREGSLHLLLSKPLGRSLLFLTKYIGGCAFVVVCVTPLVFGIWFLLGTRIGIWNHSILLALPVFLMIFAVYYSVSAWAGLVWRNALLSIMAVLIFWGCAAFLRYVVGFVVIAAVQVPYRNASLSAVSPSQSIVGVNSGTVRLFDSAANQWRTIQPATFVERWRVVGPVRTQDDRWFAVVTSIAAGPNQAAVRERLVEYKPTTNADGTAGFERIEGPEVPEPISAIAVAADGTLYLTGSAVYSFDPQSFVANKTDSADASGSDNAIANWVSGVLGGNKSNPVSLFKPIFRDVRLPVRAAWPRPGTNELYVLSITSLSRLVRDDTGQMTVTVQVELPESKSNNAIGDGVTPFVLPLLAVGRSSMALTPDRQRLLVLDPESLELRHQIEGPKGDPLSGVAIAGTNDQLFALLGSGYLNQVDPNPNGAESDLPKEGTWTVCPAPFQGRMTHLVAVDDKLWVNYDLDQVALLDANNQSLAVASVTPGGTVSKLFNWVYTPLRKFFPVPSDLNGIVDRSVQSDQQSMRESISSNTVFGATESMWRPILVNLAFTCLMLGLACWHLSRQDL
jgi:hypothetical protein